VRIFLGFLVAAVALAGAVYLHSDYKADRSRFDTGMTPAGVYVGTEAQQQAQLNSIYAVRQTVFVKDYQRAAWQDPVAVLLAVAGGGAGTAIVLSAVRAS
jgi:hypothetical protein